LGIRLRRLFYDGETFTLQQLRVTSSEDDWAGLQKDWVDVQSLDGTVQKATTDPRSHRGYEEIGTHKGYFVYNFTINKDELSNYRILDTVQFGDDPNSTFTRQFMIKRMNRNLVLDNKRIFVRFDLELVNVFPQAEGS
jgi:hypothetical protein